uniref:hypothetical protein n=1 Tax=Periconia digitata TaxID=1303443 RepID=UPI0023AA3282|nr:hypothetical protein P1Q94_mgp29 [Periconia digitata]WCA44867.1 hypothetical protein [Periconia digitata]
MIKLIQSNNFVIRHNSNNSLFGYNLNKKYLDFTNISLRGFASFPDNSGNPLLRPLVERFVFNSGCDTTRIVFETNQLGQENFVNTIKEEIDIGHVYTVFKVRYNQDSFFMAGNQFGFKYTSDSSLLEIYTNVIDRLKLYMEHYDLVQNDLFYVQLVLKKTYNSIFRSKGERIL